MKRIDRHLAELDWRDLLLSLLILAGAILHLTRFPLHLGVSDEPKQLDEARRILGGEVMYRDIFDLILPGWMYLMATVFRLFGTTLAAARTTAAALHGITAVLVFHAARRLAVRRALSCAASLAYLVLCEPAFPIASQHWLATTLSVLLLAILVRPGSVRRTLAAGVAAGLLIAVHQQRGAGLGLAAAAFLGAEAFLAPHSDRGSFLHAWSTRLGALVAGSCLVLVPLLASMAAAAGIEPLWQALVVYPLVNYPGMASLPWGQGGGLTRTYPRLLAALPLALVPTLARLALRAALPDRRRQLVLLVVFCVGGILSISYLPDFIHVAFIAPFFLITAAEGLEWTLGRMPARSSSVLGWAIALAIIVAGTARLEENLAIARAKRSVRYQSAFGPVDVAPSMTRFLIGLDALLRDDPSRTLYVHPNGAYIYLLAGAHNPTRFAFVLAGYHGPAEFLEIVDRLREARPAHVITMQALIRPDDPVARFIEENYEPLRKVKNWGFAVWARRSEAPGEH